MSVDFDTRLSGLAAQILRDAVKALNLLEGSQTGMLAVNWGATGSFQALTGSFPALTGSFAAVGHESDERVGLKELFGLGAKLAPVRLLPPAQLAQHARSAPLMAKLEALATWLGRGRLVGHRDELSDKEEAEAARWVGVPRDYLPHLWEYALTARWFELDDEPNSERTWAVPGDAARRWAEGDDSGALGVWAVVFAAVLSKAIEVAAFCDPGAARKLNFEGKGVVVAMTLFLARQAGLSLADVGGLVMGGTVGERPSFRARRAWDGWLRKHGDPARLLVSELAALNAVAVPERNGGLVGLTPLAMWALREQVMRDGVKVPVLSTRLAEMSAASLVSMADGVEETAFAENIAAWVTSRTPEQAANELLAFAAISRGPSRLVAVSLARGVGPGGHRAWRDAMQRPELRGYARITLSVMAAELPRSSLPLAIAPDQDDLARVADDLLQGGFGEATPDSAEIAATFRRAVPEGAEMWLIGLMSRNSRPQIVQVLKVLGRRHPKREIAKAARKAARRARRLRLPIGSRSRVATYAFGDVIGSVEQREPA
jgi:hypothetical protein